MQTQASLWESEWCLLEGRLQAYCILYTCKQLTEDGQWSIKYLAVCIVGARCSSPGDGHLGGVAIYQDDNWQNCFLQYYIMCRCLRVWHLLLLAWFRKMVRSGRRNRNIKYGNCFLMGCFYSAVLDVNISYNMHPQQKSFVTLIIFFTPKTSQSLVVFI